MIIIINGILLADMRFGLRVGTIRQRIVILSSVVFVVRRCTKFTIMKKAASDENVEKESRLS